MNPQVQVHEPPSVIEAGCKLSRVMHASILIAACKHQNETE
jgi:hypothetical protein